MIGSYLTDIENKLAGLAGNDTPEPEGRGSELKIAGWVTAFGSRCLGRLTGVHELEVSSGILLGKFLT
jgi:hypothetical protein